MLLQATIVRHYFVKTQTSVASFSPPDLSIIFSNGMYLVLNIVQTITVIGEHKCRVLQYDEILRET